MPHYTIDFMFKNAIQDLAKALNLEVPEPEDSGAYRFIFDKVLEISILPLKKDSLILVAPVSDSLQNSPETEKLLKKLLQINFSRLKEYEETLTWDPDSSQIILTREIPFSTLSEKPLFGQLEKFLENLEFWKSATDQTTTTSPHFP